uniref:EndoU domain-containing protein n=1 Tax=Frankia gtarii TaxID=2950102 RepID=UPI0021C197F4
GFHSAPDGHPPPDRRITEIEREFPDGTYAARVEFQRPSDGAWQEKKVRNHIMFPDSWSTSKVRQAVQEAYNQAYDKHIAPALADGRKIENQIPKQQVEGVPIRLYVGPDGTLRTAFCEPDEKA